MERNPSAFLNPLFHLLVEGKICGEELLSVVVRKRGPSSSCLLPKIERCWSRKLSSFSCVFAPTLSMECEASADLSLQLFDISAVVFDCIGAARNDQRLIGKRSPRSAKCVELGREKALKAEELGICLSQVLVSSMLSSKRFDASRFFRRPTRTPGCTAHNRRHGRDRSHFAQAP